MVFRGPVTEQVRLWRPAQDRVLMMAGTTTSYCVQPRGECVFGLIQGQPMRSRRGRERRLIAPGQLVAWDPSAAHAGTAIDGRPWTARLMVIGQGDLAAFATDAEEEPFTDIEFPDPVVSDPHLIESFTAMQTALDSPATRLECEEYLAGWLRLLLDRAATVRPARLPVNGADTRAFQRACEYLSDRPERNIGLDELAAAAGIGKFRLIRTFREHAGLPPHAFQIAHRIRLARRHLEAGHTIAETAIETGFADQSHLHRHFQRGLGMTPHEYRQRFTRDLA